jgi:hypothetical protein
MTTTLSLKDALKNNRLKDFISQEEAAGVAAADTDFFDSTIKRIVKLRKPQDQTSGSRAHDDLNGK